MKYTSSKKQDELYHHGVKGQKWGVRRTLTQLGYHSSSKGKKSSSILEKIHPKKVEKRQNPKVKKSSDSTKTVRSKQKRKSVKDMSDEELNNAIRRLELEKKYKDLDRSVSPKKASRGKKFVYDVLETSGRNIAVQAAAYGMGTVVNSVVSNLTNGEHKNIVDPKNIQKKK